MSDEQAVDRGDDFVPTETPEVEVAKAPEPEVEAKEPEVEAKADEPEAKTEDEKPRDEKGRYIPKERFDEAVRKERSEKEALAARVKEFEAQEAQRRVADDFAEANKQVKDMIKQHTSLLADGELDKASDLMEKILDLKEAIAERKAETKAVQAKDLAKEEVKYDALVAKLEADYPQINPEAEEFDRDLVADISALMTGYMQSQRLTASQALAKAVERVMPKPTKAEAKAEDLGIRRKEAAVKKALEAKAKQPASNSGVGLDHDKEGGPLDSTAVMKMSYDEFVKLPESKLAELRGDYVS